ncbi:response regulator [Thaumasiovibrio sp. DFM-14]|uniref:response regulator n=1 Tax=Thaumasiovibrio sp. DFM-14 TaxID=3384792 RepID=UPI0039A32A5E
MKRILTYRTFTLSFNILKNVREAIHQHGRLFDLHHATIEALALITTEYLTNLLRHSQRSTTISLYLYAQGKQLTFEILDDGEGWPDMQRRLDEATLPDDITTKGMGLGLIATLSPGYQYHFSPGANTFTIPILSTKNAPRVLLIDDSPSQLILLRSYLESSYDVSAFSTAQEALAWLEQNSCDLALVDLHMPHMNGFEFRQQVSQIGKHALLPLIFITGDDLPETRQHAASQAIDDYLLKPIGKASLCETLTRVLLRHKQLEQLYEHKLLAGLAPHLGQQQQQEQAGNWTLHYDCHPKPCGDFCLQHTLPSGIKLFILGDQMGHGPLARANGAAWLGFMHGYMLNSDGSIQSLYRTINRELYVTSQQHPHLMCFTLLSLHPDGTIQLINAGMPPLLHVKNNRVALLDASSGLAGMQADATAELVELSLAQGDTLHCFSDGVCESSHQLMDSSWSEAIPFSETMSWSKTIALRHQHLFSLASPHCDDDKSLLSIGRAITKD